MDQFFELLSGPIALLGSIIACLVVTHRWKRDRNPATRKPLVPLLYWGPVFLIACMVMHIIRNGYNFITLLTAGKTGFTFYHYSLQLFGVVVAYQAYLLLKKCQQHVTGSQRYTRSLYYYIGLILFTTLPTFIFTPIGIVPVPVLALTLLVSIFVHRSAVENKQQENDAIPMELPTAEPVLLP